MSKSNTHEQPNPNLKINTFWDKVDNIVDNSVQAAATSYGFNYFFGNSKNFLTNYTNYKSTLNFSSIIETGAVFSLGKSVIRRVFKEVEKLDNRGENKILDVISYKNTINDFLGSAVGSSVWAVSYTGIHNANIFDGQDIGSIAVKTGAIVMLSASLNTVLNPLYDKAIKPLTDKLGENLDKATDKLTANFSPILDKATKNISSILSPLHEKLTDKLGDIAYKTGEILSPSGFINFVSVQSAKIAKGLTR